MNVLELNNLTKRFGRQMAVDNLSLTVREGSVFGFLGPNGAGKTTTIRLIMDIYSADGGSIKVLGHPPSEHTRRYIGYLPEERGLYQDMKVLDQLRFFRELYGISKPEGEKRIHQWLARLDVTRYTDKVLSALSKGTQQKIQFIAAILHDPELVILDEPFSGLDPVSSETVKNAILELRNRGKTILFSTHQMEQVEQLCDEICLIYRGHQVLIGTLRSIKDKYPNRLLRISLASANGFLDSLAPGRVTPFPDYYEILLQTESESRHILSRLLAFDANITRFELVKPSLNEIYLETVKAAASA